MDEVLARLLTFEVKILAKGFGCNDVDEFYGFCVRAGRMVSHGAIMRRDSPNKNKLAEIARMGIAYVDAQGEQIRSHWNDDFSDIIAMVNSDTTRDGGAFLDALDEETKRALKEHFGETSN